MKFRSLFERLRQTLESEQKRHATITLNISAPLVERIMWLDESDDYGKHLSLLPPWAKCNNAVSLCSRDLADTLSLRFEEKTTPISVYNNYYADLPHLTTFDKLLEITAQEFPQDLAEIRHFVSEIPLRRIILDRCKTSITLVNVLATRCSEQELCLLFPIIQTILDIRKLKRSRAMSAGRRQTILGSDDWTPLVHTLSAMEVK